MFLISLYLLFISGLSIGQDQTLRAAPPIHGQSDSDESSRSHVSTNPDKSIDGWPVFARMNTAAYSIANAPSVAVHAGSHFDARKPLNIVVFLHGYLGCIRILMGDGKQACRRGDPLRAGWGLAQHHESARTNTLLVVPQLAFMRRNGNPGCFKKQGCFRQFLSELLSHTLASRLGRSYGLADIAEISLVAHSAGFETALAIINKGEVDSLVRNVVLMDALYSGVNGFLKWHRNTKVKNARLISFYLGSGKTYKNSQTLYRKLRTRYGKKRVVKASEEGLVESIRTHPVVIFRARTLHRLIPEKYLLDVLRALY